MLNLKIYFKMKSTFQMFSKFFKFKVQFFQELSAFMLHFL